MQLQHCGAGGACLCLGAEKFECYLWGQHFTLQTDHCALMFLFQGPTKVEQTHHSSKLMWWREHLSAFDFDVEYMQGLDNVIVDALSWLPLPSSGYALPEISHDVTLKHITGDGLTLSELQTTMAEDETRKVVLGYVWTQWLPKQQVPADLLAYYHTQNELHVEQGCLVRDCQFVPPVSLHKCILGLAQSGYPGITWMRRKV